MRASRRLPSLRKQAVFLRIRRALGETARSWFRVVQFSVQQDHIHLIVEANDRVTLSRGMAGLSIRLARAINQACARQGNVWSDRYHARALRSPREVRNGLVYVLLNFRKHWLGAKGIDPMSSGYWFDGWRVRLSQTLPSDWEPNDRVPVEPASTWLGRAGRRHHGLIALTERPKLAG
jgi:putative transposase